MKHSTPTTSTPASQERRLGGRTTTTSNGIAHVAPDSSEAAAVPALVTTGQRRSKTARGPPAIEPELLTTAEAAQLAGVGERTWWRWTRCGLAPAPVKIGIGPRAAVRYRRADLTAWIAGGCKPVDGRAAG